MFKTQSAGFVGRVTHWGLGGIEHPHRCHVGPLQGKFWKRKLLITAFKHKGTLYPRQNNQTEFMYYGIEVMQNCNKIFICKSCEKSPPFLWYTIYKTLRQVYFHLEIQVESCRLQYLVHLSVCVCGFLYIHFSTSKWSQSYGNCWLTEITRLHT
jgi:hypothetical protein